MIVEQPHRTRECHHILEPMIALAQCSKLQRIIVAGERSIELMFELERRGHVHVASTANCGRPVGQCHSSDQRRDCLNVVGGRGDELIVTGVPLSSGLENAFS
jgi:hypothetical protein